jgi:hypothetical protein
MFDNFHVVEILVNSAKIKSRYKLILLSLVKNTVTRFLVVCVKIKNLIYANYHKEAKFKQGNS